MMLTFGGFEDGCCKEEKHIRNSYLFLSGGYCGENEIVPQEAINVIAQAQEVWYTVLIRNERVLLFGIKNTVIHINQIRRMFNE